MKALGLDIGTTTVSTVVTFDGRVLARDTRPNGAFLPGREPWERVQDPARILAAADSAVAGMLSAHPDVQRIGVTGQMHGIVYLDADGRPVSPLYTWQDGRGDLPFDETHTYAQELTRRTGYPLASGYGLVTHFYNLQNGLVPAAAVTFCTIHDLAAMRLTGRTAPVTDASDAASFGLFDIASGRFDSGAVRAAGTDPAFLPALAGSAYLGAGIRGIPVSVAIGDNQASFLGAAGDGMLVNMGTGGQFSVRTDVPVSCPGMELRPFPGGGWLLAGSSLCGGRAYAILERFLRETAKAVSGSAPETAYDAMARLLENVEPDDLPKVTPLFQGTREDPSLRASFTGLSESNFTPSALIRATLYGMARELYEKYAACRDTGISMPKTLYGSGNALRRNPALVRAFEKVFGMPLHLSPLEEEAACGAAAYAVSMEVPE